MTNSEAPCPSPNVLSKFFYKETAIALGNAAYKDVKIILSDDPDRPEYRLHKFILALHSSFFRHLFRHEPKEVYEIGAMTREPFEAFISYIYGGKKLRKQRVDEIVKRLDLISQELEEGLEVEEYSKEWSQRMKALRKEAADLGKRI